MLLTKLVNESSLLLVLEQRLLFFLASVRSVCFWPGDGDDDDDDERRTLFEGLKVSNFQTSPSDNKFHYRDDDDDFPVQLS